MAMTGTGTQADPYIVDTWADFVTAVGTAQAYVEFPVNTIIDMNNVQPEGIDSNIVFKCTQFDAKGGEINGLFLRNGQFRNDNNSPIIKNLKLTEMRADKGAFYMDGGKMQNCIIAGSFGGEVMFDTIRGRFTLESCSVNAQLQSGTYFADSYWGDDRSLTIKNSIVNLSGSVRSDGNTLVLNNSTIRGVIPTTYFYELRNSVIDCVVPSDTSLRSAGHSNDYGYINSSKFNEGVTTTNRFTQVSDDQLHDAEYLYSIGFPIGVD